MYEQFSITTKENTNSNSNKSFFFTTELMWVRSDNSVEKNANNEEIAWQLLNWRVGETAQWWSRYAAPSEN